MKQSLMANLKRAREQVAEAAIAAGRQPESVTIVAVSKYVDAEQTWQLVRAGGFDLGESRPQSLWDKHRYISERLAQAAATYDAATQSSGTQDVGPGTLHWHMIGHLQRNKAARTVALIDWLHSLDSLRLADCVHAEALKYHKRLKVLLEVNVTQDQAKTGLPADQAAGALQHLLDLSGLEVRGLMAMSTDGATADQARREFESVRELRDHLQTQFGGACNLSELSMGMSGDFHKPSPPAPPWSASVPCC